MKYKNSSADTKRELYTKIFIKLSYETKIPIKRRFSDYESNTNTFIFISPLQLHNDGLAERTVKERNRIYILLFLKREKIINECIYGMRGVIQPLQSINTNLTLYLTKKN